MTHTSPRPCGGFWKGAYRGVSCQPGGCSSRGLFIHYTEPVVKVKATSDESPQSNYTCWSSAPLCPARSPLRTAWAAFCRHLLCPWASLGRWAPCQHRTLGAATVTGTEGSCGCGTNACSRSVHQRIALHLRILILNKKEFNSWATGPVGSIFSVPGAPFNAHLLSASQTPTPPGSSGLRWAKSPSSGI